MNAGYLEVGGDTNLAVVSHHDDQTVGVLDHELVDLGLAKVAGGNADLGVNAGAAHNADIGIDMAQRISRQFADQGSLRKMNLAP